MTFRNCLLLLACAAALPLAGCSQGGTSSSAGGPPNTVTTDEGAPADPAQARHTQPRTNVEGSSIPGEDPYSGDSSALSGGR